MLRYNVSIAVARANPALLRTISLAGSYTAGELVRLACLSLGIEPKTAALEWNGETGKDTQPLSSVFSSEGSGVIRITPPQARKGRDCLTLFVDLLLPDEAPEGTIPKVTRAIGGNLLEGCYDMADFNRIRAQLATQSVLLDGGSRYSAASLEYSERRTANAICKLYAPEQAYAEVSHALALPLPQMLSELRMPELRELCTALRLYPPSPVRKAELISLIENNCDVRFLRAVFASMSLQEYLSFRALVLQSDASADPGDLSLRLPLLCRTGLASAQNGGHIALEALEYYESWFDTARAESFLQEKTVEAALRACRAIYGIFSYEMYRSVLAELSPAAADSEEARDAFSENRSLALARLEEGVLFSSMDLTQREARAIWSRRPKGLSWFLPPAETVLSLSAGDGFSLSPELRREILELIHDSSYASYRDVEDPSFLDYYDMILHLTHTGIDPEQIACAAAERADWHIGISSREKFVRGLQPLIVRAQRELPLIVLAGYTSANCPPELFRALQAEAASAPAPHIRRRRY